MNLVNPRWCKDKFGYILLFYEWIKMRDTTKKNEEGKKEKLWDYNVTLSLLHIQYLVKRVLKKRVFTSCKFNFRESWTFFHPDDHIKSCYILHQ